MLSLLEGEGMPSWGPLTGLRSGPMEPHGAQQRSAGSCPAIPDTPTAWKEEGLRAALRDAGC